MTRAAYSPRINQLVAIMASNLLSRLLPGTIGSPSIYETIRQQDEDSDHSDIEERAGMALDEENLGERFHDYELEDALAHASESQMTTRSPELVAKDASSSNRTTPVRGARRDTEQKSRSRGRAKRQGLQEVEELDDEVPASLLVEGASDGEGNLESPPRPPVQPAQRLQPDLEASAIPVPGPSTNQVRQQWETVQAQQRLHPENWRNRSSASRPLVQRPRPGLMMNPKDRAMWRWANVENLDNYLKDVYMYFMGNGIWCIGLGRALNLLYVYRLAICLLGCTDNYL